MDTLPRVIISTLWMDRPIAYVVREVAPGIFRYEYVELKRAKPA